MTTLKRGTRIEALLGMGVVEGAKILRPYAPDLPGFWLIRFDNGDQLGMHEIGFRVIDNRA